MGEVIGVGIFLTPAGMAKSLGSPGWLLAVWLTMGAGAIGGALCFGALAARYPEAGGSYVYLREAYGPRTAFLYGWLSLLVTDPGLTAMLAVGLANYVAYLVPLSTWELKGVAVAAIMILAAVNMLGVSLGSGVLRVLVGPEARPAGFPRGLGLRLGRGDWSNLTPFWAQRPGSDPLLPALGVGLIGAFISFAGWWDVSKIAGEVRDPERNLAASLGAGRVDRHGRLHRRQRGVPLPGAARPDRVGRHGLRGPGGRGPLRTSRRRSSSRDRHRLGGRKPGRGAHGISRVYYAMARDGLFFPSIAAVDPRRGTPTRSIAIQAALASVLALTGTFDQILDYFMVPTLAFLALTVAAVFVLRRRHRPPRARADDARLSRSLPCCSWSRS